ncbi:MAG TPA: hypothetical protein VEX36_11860 [Thermoleophilaceae bacterium]|nr:hypothetical protein [Thermoleophilaceae bacterium]
MSEVMVPPARRLGTDVEAQLGRLAEQRMVAPARRRGIELRLVGATVLPQQQVIVRTDRGAWLFVDHVEDPTGDGYGGGIPVPERERAKLVELDRAGVRPDLLWLVHELPSSWREGDPIPQLVPTPRHLREKDQRLAQRLRFATKLLVKGAGATVAAATAPIIAAGAAVAAVGLDPIVLGGVRHPDMPVVQWALLAQWDWE